MRRQQPVERLAVQAGVEQKRAKAEPGESPHHAEEVRSVGQGKPHDPASFHARKAHGKACGEGAGAPVEVAVGHEIRVPAVAAFAEHGVALLDDHLIDLAQRAPSGSQPRDLIGHEGING